MKKIIACLVMICLLFCAALPGLPAFALGKTEAKVTLKASKTTCAPGEEISVVIRPSCGADIKSFNFYVNFDKKVLEWQSLKTTCIANVNGTFQKHDHTEETQSKVRVTYTYKGSGNILKGSASDAITLVFKVKAGAAAGNTSLTLSDGPGSEAPVYNKSGQACTTTYTPAKLTITSAQALRANARLSSLTVKGCTLSPKFSSGTFDYTLYVPRTVQTLSTDAKTVNSSASAEIKPGYQDGKVVKISVVVTAADGKTTQTYVLNIKKGDPPSSGASSASSSQSSSSSQPSSAPSSEPSSEPATSVSEISSDPYASSEPSSAPPVLPGTISDSSTVSSEDESSEGFFAAVLTQAEKLIRNGPLLFLLGVFVLLVILVAALPLSKRRKRKYIRQLLARGYIINPQLDTMYSQQGVQQGPGMYSPQGVQQNPAANYPQGYLNYPFYPPYDPQRNPNDPPGGQSGTAYPG